MTESYKLIKQNGDELEFNNYDFFLQSLPNFGNPDIQYTTQTTFFQDGANVTNFVVSPRSLSIPLLGLSDEVKTRTDFWNFRKEILRFLSPVSGPMTFQMTLDDHVVYELTNVFATNGLSMEGNTFTPDRNDGRIEESLKITAYDPIWRVSPINTSGELIPTIAEELVFPIEFPIIFGGSGAVFDTTINYEGTWRSYPKFTINGPYNTAAFTNKQNGAMFQMIRPIATGETRIIDLSDPVNGFSVTDGSGNNKIGEMNLTVNFTQFYFVPDATNGIDAVLNGGDIANTKLTIEYYTKYLGI